MAAGVDRDALANVIALINGKGGVGKSTITANAGGLMALSGWRVLLVDLDFQGNLGRDLGYRETDRDDRGEALAKGLLFPSEAPQILREVRPNLDVLVGGKEVESASAAMNSRQSTPDGRESAQLSLARLLTHVAADYDIILLDCPPGDDIIQTAAVAAARWVLIPTRGDDGSLDGLKITTERFDHVQALNPDLDLLGIIIFDSSKSSSKIRANFSTKAAKLLANDDPEVEKITRKLVFDSYVTHSETVPFIARGQGKLAHEIDDAVKAAPKWYELRRQGKSTHDAGPASASSVADSMQAVTAEIISRLDAARNATEHDGAEEHAHV